MKILIIFIDMIRPNRLSTFNSNIKKDTPLDHSLKKLGGTFYTQCFSVAPDTPRGMAAFATGQLPYQNGCDSRVKWPRYFLNEDKDSLYHLFADKGYALTFFSNPNERETGMFPESISKMDIHNHDYDLDGYLSKVKLQKNHFVFISLPDFHWSFDDNSYTTFGEQQAYHDVQKSYDVIFKNFKKDDFDHIFVFSDHGFKFFHEFKRQPQYFLLNEDRTNILMIHRQKNDKNNIVYNDKLCAITDIYPSIQQLLGEQQITGLPLLSSQSQDEIIIEDHLEFSPTVNQNLGIWAVIRTDEIYIRTLAQGYCLNRHSREIIEKINQKDDELLKQKSDFSKYINEYEKVFSYRKFIFKQTLYMYGGKRKKITKLLKYFYSIKDFIFQRLKP